ncbi:inhibitor of growth protein 5b isoform X2 [Hoplias malabaricus]
MTELDGRIEVKKSEIEALAAEYMKNVRSLTPEERMECLKRIDDAYNKCREFSDDKVQLALQIYELVDKHIRRLDTDLARFERELKEKLESSTPESSEEKKNRKDKNSKDKRRRSGRSQKASNHNSPIHTAQKHSEVLLEVNPSDVLDMPVDPNEPTYCVCSQVSYGEMIGCDNADCPIEWFHFACVDLTTKPKGKWFCPRCAPEMKKK